jgi:hypothetical protein
MMKVILETRCHEYMGSPLELQELLTLHEYLGSSLELQELLTLHEYLGSSLELTQEANPYTHEG